MSGFFRAERVGSAPSSWSVRLLAVVGAVSLVVGIAAISTPASAAGQVPAKGASTCAKTYKVRSGDGWTIIAKRVKVKVSKLYAANGATAKTTIYPGRSICLPAGATAVSNESPTTTKAPATKAPVTTVPPKAVPPTTAPATTVPARTYQPSEVEAIIRSTWPDELEEKALAITWRESNNKPGARNSCCYGLFQLNYSAHRRWLSDIGVSSASQLLDPQVNATAALTLYHRAGGWGPWGG